MRSIRSARVAASIGTAPHSFGIIRSRNDVRRVNHSQEYKAEDGANVNQAESYFSRLRRAEIGQHHRISGHLLHQYANEAAWREDNRRNPNGTNWNAVIGASFAGPKRQAWTGYWDPSAA